MVGAGPAHSPTELVASGSTLIGCANLCLLTCLYCSSSCSLDWNKEEEDGPEVKMWRRVESVSPIQEVEKKGTSSGKRWQHLAHHHRSQEILAQP